MTTTAIKKRSNMGDFIMRIAPLTVLAILYILFSIMHPGRFMTMANQMNVLRQTAVNCLIGSGMLLALITAGIDLSVEPNASDPAGLAPSLRLHPGHEKRAVGGRAPYHFLQDHWVYKQRHRQHPVDWPGYF